MTQSNGDGRGAVSKQHTPRLIFWEVTKGCNLRCIHCRATATELMSPADLPTIKALDIISQIADFGSPILVLSGGEPLYRHDIFQLAEYATSRGLRTALATNGTLVTKDVAEKINLQALGVSVQINTTIARHNAGQLPAVLELARSLGADALHTFLLVPVGCGVDIAAEQMVAPEEYERMLNWFYDQSLEGGIELKATCAPHYFRVARQRKAADRIAGRNQVVAPAPSAHDIGPTDMTMPGSTGINLKPGGGPPVGHSGHPGDMNAMTKGCLAGTGVCFISHEGEVFPCGYLPAIAGDLRKQSFAEIWNDSDVFAQLREDDNLKGKCGSCEFRHVCMGCRARAFAATGDFLAEEPFCVYEPGTSNQMIRAAAIKTIG
jgi:radical SAM protein with 4Fe4S-binding SPASM domain